MVKILPQSGDLYWSHDSSKPLLDSGGSLIAIKYSAFKLIDINSKYWTLLSHLKDDDWVYPFAGAPRDEATMLRLLKLRAFL